MTGFGRAGGWSRITGLPGIGVAIHRGLRRWGEVGLTMRAEGRRGRDASVDSALLCGDQAGRTVKLQSGESISWCRQDSLQRS